MYSWMSSHGVELFYVPDQAVLCGVLRDLEYLGKAGPGSSIDTFSTYLASFEVALSRTNGFAVPIFRHSHGVSYQNEKFK